MSDLWINIRFWKWYLQIGPTRMSLKRSLNQGTYMRGKKIEVYQFFGYHSP